MSKLGKTSENIKKKLSLGDYGKPVRKQDDKPVQQRIDKPVEQPIVMPATQPVVLTAAKRQKKELKTKATYYIGKEEMSMLTKMYIEQLKKTNKADRSALVCEAIRLLYENKN